MYDFNNAPTQRDGEFELIPDGTIVPVQLTIRPGNAGEGGWLKRSRDGDCMMIDAEFIVTEGQYAKRKFWSYMTIEGQTDGQKKAVEISVARIRAMLESARGIKPSDESPAASERRRISSYGDLDGARFWVVVGIEEGGRNKETGKAYKDKNTLKTVITPDRSEWRQLEQRGSSSTAPAAHVAAAASTKPAAAAATGRPSWA